MLLASARPLPKGHDAPPKHGSMDQEFAANVARDRRVLSALRHSGFVVAVIWECETADPSLLKRKIVRRLRLAMELPNAVTRS